MRAINSVRNIWGDAVLDSALQYLWLEAVRQDAANGPVVEPELYTPRPRFLIPIAQRKAGRGCPCHGLILLGHQVGARLQELHGFRRALEDTNHG
jgi:hypothetical protein